MHHNYATTLDDFKDAVAKERHLREALRLWPSYLAAYANLGVVLAKGGKLDEAVSVWKTGLEAGTKVVGPVVGTTITNIASGLTNLGQFEEAIVYWERALRIRPHEQRVINGLANAKQQLHRQQGQQH